MFSTNVDRVHLSVIPKSLTSQMASLFGVLDQNDCDKCPMGPKCL